MSSKRGWLFPIMIFLLICLNTFISACDNEDSSEAGTPALSNSAHIDKTVWKGADTGYDSGAVKENGK